ncbi:hypothetical protein DAPPUDRAFT_239369 [Daphnia pulex]|uniref:Uncharacterized protein n=1 Tax=Daphnia pulex TaxID=6669 RepID=E9G938_DAPPU|nr:hypothetical protein DAPPUDRAFT_239364 [Daphnia pulex]EFX84163.1 hypothetical protein DAPPUDRAFT_239369 [Daphnia pulex]|eukprot:EFX84084.1 hypothetical protein DAPPUDRAFT_239364 [Daphnia pulex]
MKSMKSAHTNVMNFVLGSMELALVAVILAFCDVLISVWNNWTLGNPHSYSRPIPSNVNLKKEKPVCISFNRRSWRSLINYAVVLLLGVVSLMAGSTTGVQMSPEYGAYQSTTLSPYYTTYDTTSCYTDASKYYTTMLP